MKNLKYVVGILAFAFLFSQCEKEPPTPSYEIGDIHPNSGIVFDVNESGERGLVCQTEDLGSMNWYDAVEACQNLGDGWHLPTKDELNLMYTNLHQNGLGGFAPSVYWSSTEVDNEDAWLQSFDFGIQDFFSKNFNGFQVRAVRAF